MTFLNQSIFYQGKDVHKIEDNPNKDFSYSANGLSTTNYEFILGKIKENRNHDIIQYRTTEYLGCHLDSNLSTEAATGGVL